jgi:hypothetical protein
MLLLEIMTILNKTVEIREETVVRMEEIIMVVKMDLIKEKCRFRISRILLNNNSSNILFRYFKWKNKLILMMD